MYIFILPFLIAKIFLFFISSLILFFVYKTDNNKKHAYPGFFGCSLDLRGNRLAVGAYGEDKEAGSVYTYTHSQSGGWTRDAIYTEENKMAGNRFGWSVSTDGFNIVVGSRDTGYSRDSEVNSHDSGKSRDSAVNARDSVSEARSEPSGAAYVYIPGKEYPERRKLSAYEGTGEQWFGRAVNIREGRVVVGSYRWVFFFDKKPVYKKLDPPRPKF